MLIVLNLSALLCSSSFCSSSWNSPLFFFFCSAFSPRTAANMWFHLSCSEIRVEKNRLMVISLSLPLSLLSLSSPWHGLMKGPVYFALVSNSTARKKKGKRKKKENCRCGLLATPTQKCWPEKIKTKQRRQRGEQKDLQLPCSSCKRMIFSGLFCKNSCWSAPLAGYWTSWAEDDSLWARKASSEASCLMLPPLPSEGLSH